MMQAEDHKPVLLDEAIQALAIKPVGHYVDGTFGRGGHSSKILQRLRDDGQLTVFDRDPSAIAVAKERFADDMRVRIHHRNFSAMAKALQQDNALGDIDGLLLDLGVSSPQFDEAERGFSFREAGPLDMRMNPQAGSSLEEWINTASKRDIAWVLKTYGEEPFAKKIAKAIVLARKESPLVDTATLAQLIKDAMPERVTGPMKRHPATRSFQAFRIHINGELDELENLLKNVMQILSPGGRLVIISFHSLEDRLVKRFIRGQAQPEASPLPMVPRPEAALLQIGKAISASEEELAQNPRARSAIMRVAERTTAQVISI